MNAIFLLGLSALLLCSPAQKIICKSCRSGNGKGCYEREETCKTYGQCYTSASFSGEELYYLRYSCVYHRYAAWFCNTTMKRDPYVFVSSCCTTDKCNGEISFPHKWN